MLPLHTHAKVTGVSGTAILKVLEPDEARQSAIEPARCLLWVDGRPNHNLFGQRFAGTIGADADIKDNGHGITVQALRSPGVVAPGDVVRLAQDSSLVSVQYRRGSNSNTLFATERCNSFCVMCSQPPRAVDDTWRVAEMLRTIELVDRDEVQLGISGGEPTLLGDGLITILHHARMQLPKTGLHILSNGRAFAEDGYARAVCAVRHHDLVWGIPLYSDAPEIHDYVVQAQSAWDETLTGLYNLARHGAAIEVRIVVQQANMERLGELARFIFRNLTFASHVAFMGLEPMGFAKRNRESIWVDPADCGAALEDAVHFLTNRGMVASIYNFPLCTMPRSLWPYCRQSISDWKNVYRRACASCAVQGQCCGFFRSVGPGWISRAIAPVRWEEQAKEGEAVS